MGYDEREYWESRYQSGGNSGAGSSGPEADFKVKIVNTLIRKYAVSSLLDLGCGDGQIAERILQKYPDFAYHGLDVSNKAIDLCRARVSNGSFSIGDFTRDPVPKHDMVLCLDVLFHLSSKEKHDAAVAAICRSFDRVAVVAAWNDRILKKYKRLSYHTFYRPFEPVQGTKVAKVWEISHTPSKSLYVLTR